MTTKFRGAMVPPFVPLADVEALLQHKANVIRYQLTDIAVEELPPAPYKTWVRQHMDHIETLLPVLEAHNAKVVIDLHTPPAGVDRTGKFPVARMFTNRPWGKECFMEVWEEIAHQFVDAPEVLAFDLMNEPQCPTAGTAADLTALYRATIKRIRAKAPNTPVIVSPPYGDPERVHQMSRFTNRHVWYTVHVYTMQPMTHQGIPPFPAGKTYPNEHTNNARIVKALSQMLAFQKKINCKVFVGEFGFSTLGDWQSRRRWFRDVINLCEKYGWDYTAHAWREAPIWQWEEPPELFQVFKKAWARNGEESG